MRRALLVIGGVWLLLLAGLAGGKMFTLQTGREVLLRTVPVDPRDLFRGDYVVLSYDLSTIDVGQAAAPAEAFETGEPIYVRLAERDGYAAPAGVSKRPPGADALCLRGRVADVDGTQVRVLYGIESYFVPEGKGRVLEQARGKPLAVRAAVDRFGGAAIKGLVLNGQDVRFR